MGMFETTGRGMGVIRAWSSAFYKYTKKLNLTRVVIEFYRFWKMKPFLVATPIFQALTQFFEEYYLVIGLGLGLRLGLGSGIG